MNPKLRKYLKRDAEWTKIVLGIKDRILSPAEAAKWLEEDRKQRCHNVSDARMRRGPQPW
jgi:hypothetical protein